MYNSSNKLFLLKERIYDISKRQYNNVFISGTLTKNEKILASIFLTTKFKYL